MTAYLPTLHIAITTDETFIDEDMRAKGEALATEQINTQLSGEWVKVLKHEEFITYQDEVTQRFPESEGHNVYYAQYKVMPTAGGGHGK